MQRESKYFVGSVVLLVAMFLLILTAGLHAQEVQPAQGYLFAGPGAAVHGGSSGSTYHFGGGGESHFPTFRVAWSFR